MCNSSNVGQEARGGQDNRRAAGSWQQHWETEREHQPRAALPAGTTPTPAAQHQPAPPPFPIPASLAHCGTGSFQRLSKEKGTKVLNGVTDMSAGVRKGLKQEPTPTRRRACFPGCSPCGDAFTCGRHHVGGWPTPVPWH